MRERLGHGRHWVSGLINFMGGLPCTELVLLTQEEESGLGNGAGDEFSFGHFEFELEYLDGEVL